MVRVLKTQSVQSIGYILVKPFKVEFNQTLFVHLLEKGVLIRQLESCPVRLNSTCLEEKICKTLIRRFICNVWFYFCNNAGVNTISSSGISVSPK